MSNNPSLTIRKLHARHKQENPDSMISEKLLRAAVRSGELPSVTVGNRALVSWNAFERWRSGELGGGNA